MSKRSRKRRKKALMKNRSSSDATCNSQLQPTATPSPTPISAPSVLKRIRKRRTLWLAIVVFLVAIAGSIIVKLQNQGVESRDPSRPGIVEYMSDDPDAQVVMEKDGQETFLERGTKYSTKVEPGHYKIRLRPPSEGLKVTPFLNMDPGGRGIVRVERIRKAPNR